MNFKIPLIRAEVQYALNQGNDPRPGLPAKSNTQYQHKFATPETRYQTLVEKPSSRINSSYIKYWVWLRLQTIIMHPYLLSVW